MNYFDMQNKGEVEEDFQDIPDEVTEGSEAPLVDPAIAGAARPVRPKTATVQLPEVEAEEESAEEAEEDSSEILTDARFRLEQGRLYEMVLNHDIFDGVEADKRAIKSVQNEIRAYAQERMEIMLGMRQEKSQEDNTNAYAAFNEVFPFNSLEVEALKSLAAAATKGASRDAAPLEIGPQAPPPRTSLNPIGKGSGQTKPVVQKKVAKPIHKEVAPVKRTRSEAEIRRILEEEGVTMDEVNQVFDPKKKYLSPDDLANLTPEQVIERNKQITLRNRQASNPAALPMPTQDQIEAVLLQRANQAAAHPQMQQIMGLLDEAQKKKGL